MSQRFPLIASQWDYDNNGDVTPSDVAATSNKKAHWVCNKGHQWETVIAYRSANGDNDRCPICIGRKLVVGVNDLATAYPDIAAQWYTEKNDFTPHSVTSGSKRKVWWLCEKGHYWQAPVYRRTGDVQSGCPYCTNKKAWSGFNDLASRKPDVVSQWDYEKNTVLPTEVTEFSMKKVWWICDKGHSFELPVATQSINNGCRVCSNKIIIKGVNDFFTRFPDIARQWDTEKNGMEIPYDVVVNSKESSTKKYWWLCDERHSTQQTITAKVKGSGCSVCSNNVFSQGYNDFESQQKDLLEEWDWDRNDKHPGDYHENSHSIVAWVCKDNDSHQWNASISSRVLGYNNCPRCYGYRSMMEKDLCDYVVSLVGDSQVRSNVRDVISPYELDIYVPSKNIAIEFNGLFWHTEDAGKDRNYHYKKWEMCREQGIQLITIWEDEWRDKKDIVCSMLSHKLGMSTDRKLFARKTEVVFVDKDVARKFCDSHHIQGFVPGSAYIALSDSSCTHDRGDDTFYDSIVAVSIWRKNGDILYLDRYCTSATVVGGMGKLLKTGKKYAKDNGHTTIVTFADHQVSDGGLYKSLGFTQDKIIKPDYRYLHEGKRKHKFGFRLNRFRNDPLLKFIPGYTEKQLAELNHLPRIWDYGKTRYIIDV